MGKAKRAVSKSNENNLVTETSAKEDLDKYLNEAYKNVNLKKEYTESFLKKNNDSYLKTESKCNVSVSKINTSVSKTPRNNRTVTESTDKQNVNSILSKLDDKRSTSKPKLRVTNALDTKKDSNNKSNILNTSKQSISSVSYYLDRRHMETQEKINNMRSEQLKQEHSELREKPKLSKKSLEIAQRLNSSNVVDRLTSKSQSRKRNEELKMIERNNSQGWDRPKINESSQMINRTIDDLFDWKRRVEIKNMKKQEEEINKLYSKPRTQSSSERILMEKSPTYLQTKVEDRLTAKGKNYKIKIEENKKSFYEHLTPQNKNVSFLTSNKIKNEPSTSIHEELEKNYRNTQKNSPSKTLKINTIQNSPYKHNFINSPCNEDIDKLIKVRKNLSGYLSSKYNKDKVFKLNSDQQPIKTLCSNEETKSETSFASPINSVTNNKNKFLQKKVGDKAGYKIINYDLQNSKDDYILELNRDPNPYSEIEKYDKMLLSDKPFNYFTNYPMPVNSAPNKTSFLNVQKQTLTDQRSSKLDPNHYQIYKHTQDAHLKLPKKVSQNQDIINSTKHEENYIFNTESSQNENAEKRLLESKTDQRANFNPTLPNQTISNLTAIPNETHSKLNYTLTESVKNEVHHLSNKSGQPTQKDNSLSLKRKDVLNNFKNYLTEVEKTNINSAYQPQEEQKKENPYRAEFERNLQNLDLVNERLKLNDEGKRFIFSKINMINNNLEAPKGLEIGSEIEKFSRKK